MASQRLPRVGAASALVAGLLVALGHSAAAGVSPDEVAVGAAVIPPAQLAAVAANPNSPINLTVALAPRDEGELDAFVAAVSTPGSPRYRQFLAPGEFGSRFGATSTAIAAVGAALRERGLQVGPVSANGLSIPVSGTVATVGAAFHTSFASYRLPSGRAALANTAAPTLPASVATFVRGVIGLDQTTQATPSAGPAAAAIPAVAGPTACAAANSAAADSGAYVPAQLAHHYGIDSLYDTTTGHGSTVALFELEPFSASDVAAYQTCFGTATSVSVRQVDGGAGTGAGSGQATSSESIRPFNHVRTNASVANRMCSDLSFLP